MTHPRPQQAKCGLCGGKAQFNRRAKPTCNACYQRAYRLRRMTPEQLDAWFVDWQAAGRAYLLVRHGWEVATKTASRLQNSKLLDDEGGEHAP